MIYALFIGIGFLLVGFTAYVGTHIYFTIRIRRMTRAMGELNAEFRRLDRKQAMRRAREENHVKIP